MCGARVREKKREGDLVDVSGAVSLTPTLTLRHLEVLTGHLQTLLLTLALTLTLTLTLTLVLALTLTPTPLTVLAVN